jgi:hypothetical protein
MNMMGTVGQAASLVGLDQQPFLVAAASADLDVLEMAPRVHHANVRTR